MILKGKEKEFKLNQIKLREVEKYIKNLKQKDGKPAKQEVVFPFLWHEQCRSITERMSEWLTIFVFLHRHEECRKRKPSRHYGKRKVEECKPFFRSITIGVHIIWLNNVG